MGSGYGVAVKGAATRLAASTAVEPTYIVSGNAARMAEVRAAGNAGEVAAGIVKNTKRIPAPSGSASFRIPDELTASRLGEVKNVASLRWTDQLSDFLSYSSTRGLDFVIYVRRSTRLDSTLTNLEREGRIKIDR